MWLPGSLLKGYLHALFMRLGVGKNAGTVSECEWVGLD
jgi:hypothetical protein